jgi:outer membrane receptor protein involved in Fe transport
MAHGKKMPGRKTVCLSLLLMILNLAAFGQSTSATLSGNVTDVAGKPMASVTIAIQNLENGTSKTVLTDENGNYRLVNLEPGNYEMSAKHEGFRTVTQPIQLTVGGTVSADLLLQVAGAAVQEAKQKSREKLISQTQTDISRVISSQSISSLPNIGRNFVDFVKLSSAVRLGRENIGGGIYKEPDTGVGVASAPRLSFGGQPELHTMIQVDGADAVQTVTGLPHATPSQEAAREFRIINNTYLAEYGRALGGFVNIVTKSGGNKFAGQAYYFGMNNALNARSILNTAEANVLRQNQFGGTFGGPLKKEKTFFFTSYEAQRRAESNRFAQIVLNNLTGINAVRTRYGLSPEVSSLLRSNDYNQGLARLDHRFNDDHLLSARYYAVDSTTLNFLGGGGRGAATSSTSRNNYVNDQSLVLTETSVFTSSLINEARFNWARRGFNFVPNHKEPVLGIANLLIMGKSSSDMDYYLENRYQLADNLQWLWGNHQMKFGGDAIIVRDKTRFDYWFPGNITFASISGLLNFQPTSLAWEVLKGQTHPGFDVSWKSAVPRGYDDLTTFQINHNHYGAFAQDQWRVIPKLTLTYGLRYDIDRYPAQYIQRQDRNNFQPRVGAAWAYSENGVIRAGYGMFNDRLAASLGQVFVTAAFWNAGDNPNSQTLFPDIAPFGGRFFYYTYRGATAAQNLAAVETFLKAGVVPNVTSSSRSMNLNGGLRNPYSHQASLQIAHQLTDDLAVSATYLMVKGQNLVFRSQNLSAVQTGTLPSGKPLLAGRRFAELGEFNAIDNIGWSNYHGGTFEAMKRFSQRFGLTASYTWSKTISNGEGPGSLADAPEYDLQLERALSRQHLAHRFTLDFSHVVSPSTLVLGGFRFNSYVSLESGRPYTIYVGSDTNQDANSNSDRPGTLGRNTLIGPKFASVDLRVGREFKLSDKVGTAFTFDFFNLLNRVNIRDLNTVYGAADLSQPPNASFGYLQPKDVFSPRQIQFGFKLNF